MKDKLIFTSIAGIIACSIQYLYSLFIATNISSDALRLFVNVVLLVGAVYLAYFIYLKLFRRKSDEIS